MRDGLLEVITMILKSYHQVIMRWGLAGFIIRVGLIPFFVYSDVLNFWNICNKINEGMLNFYINYKIFYHTYPPICYLFASILWIFNQLKSISILPIQDVNILLIVMKFPFLIADFLIGIIFLLYLDDKRDAEFAFKLWMLNPMSIFMTYIIGWYEIISALLFMLTLYLIKKKYVWLGAFLIGLNAIIHPQLIILIPPVVIALMIDDKREMHIIRSLNALVCALIPIFLANFALYISVKDYVVWRRYYSYIYYSCVTNSIMLMSGVGAVRLSQIIFPVLYIFSMLCGVILERNLIERVQMTIFQTMFAYYISTRFYPQFFIWMLPFLILLIVQTEKKFRMECLILYIIQSIFYPLYVLCVQEGVITTIFIPTQLIPLKLLPSTNVILKVVQLSTRLTQISFMIMFMSINVLIISLTLERDLKEMLAIVPTPLLSQLGDVFIISSQFLLMLGVISIDIRFLPITKIVMDYALYLLTMGVIIKFITSRKEKNNSNQNAHIEVDS